MNKKLIKIIAAMTVTAMFTPAYAETEKLPAFPGAEGGGMYASGARENVREIYHVTTLEDSSAFGTLRDAVSGDNRIVVFDVAGNIELKNALNITGSNLTILGQTAPGDGICIRNNTTYMLGSNIIMRYLRFRMGDDATVEDDSLGGRGMSNVIIDHCSVTWSTDECASFYENENFTMQWCIIAESLKQSVHAKGSHGYGGIWGGKNASFHHNLIADHDSRNPRIATAGIDEAYEDVSKQVDLTDLINNVVYNWGGNSAYGGENGAPVNLINCYYKPGPATTKKERLFQISAKAEGDNTGTNSLNRPHWGTDLYVSGNVVEGSASVTADNTKGVDKDANSEKYGVWTDANIPDEEKLIHERYRTDYPVTVQAAEEAYTAVLDGAGASIARDSIDTRIIKDARTGTATYGNGIINTQSEVGGYPELTGTKAKDSDNDGIPNEWEDAHGLNKFDRSDAAAKTESGYLNIEVYANALADGSYVRDINYDLDVPDYDPGEDPDVTPSPTPQPEKELVNEWIAKSGDETAAAGTEFMPGLSPVIQLSRAMPNEVNFDDGSKFNFAVSHKDTSGGWDAANKCAKGCALKYTAQEDGIFTLYGYSVSGTKTFYVMPEGAASVAECVYSQEYTGSSVPILYSHDVKKGETYYYYIDGSKMRFCAAKLEKYKPVPENCVKITVTYNEDGSMKSVSTENTTTDKITAAENTGSTKVFYWNSLDGMKPAQ